MRISRSQVSNFFRLDKSVCIMIVYSSFTVFYDGHFQECSRTSTRTTVTSWHCSMVARNLCIGSRATARWRHGHRVHATSCTRCLVTIATRFQVCIISIWLICFVTIFIFIMLCNIFLYGLFIAHNNRGNNWKTWLCSLTFQ